MREQQPEALRLVNNRQNAHLVSWQANACTELRRLHALNAELLEALKWIDRRCPEKYFDAYPGKIHWEAAHDAGACARAAIAKAEGKEHA